MERPKPFNTWELLDSVEHAVQLLEAGVVNLKPPLTILLMLNSDFGAEPTAKILLQAADIGIYGRGRVGFPAPTSHQRLRLPN